MEVHAIQTKLTKKETIKNFILSGQSLEQYSKSTVRINKQVGKKNNRSTSIVTEARLQEKMKSGVARELILRCSKPNCKRGEASFELKKINAWHCSPFELINRSLEDDFNHHKQDEIACYSS